MSLGQATSLDILPDSAALLEVGWRGGFLYHKFTCLLVQLAFLHGIFIFKGFPFQQLGYYCFWFLSQVHSVQYLEVRRSLIFSLVLLVVSCIQLFWRRLQIILMNLRSPSTKPGLEDISGSYYRPLSCVQVALYIQSLFYGGGLMRYSWSCGFLMIKGMRNIQRYCFVLVSGVPGSIISDFYSNLPLV